MVNKSYKFRMYPDDEQAKAMWKNIGSARFMFNQLLSDSIKLYDLYQGGVLTKEECYYVMSKTLQPPKYKKRSDEEAKLHSHVDSYDFLKRSSFSSTS